MKIDGVGDLDSFVMLVPLPPCSSESRNSKLLSISAEISAASSIVSNLVGTCLSSTTAPAIVVVVVDVMGARPLLIAIWLNRSCLAASFSLRLRLRLACNSRLPSSFKCSGNDMSMAERRKTTPATINKPGYQQPTQRGSFSSIGGVSCK